MKPKFELSTDKKESLVETIKVYFEQERDEKIGDLAAVLILEFFMEKLAPTFYNIGIEDGHALMTEKVDDMFGIMK
ncbi:DUF2164 domain-containing protein [Virgibacillus byunsanensis]|uniref:DUF2164 domain-containing protein n=1 Tax=Virgibacillus byunsanensis TaxID=570945 RepID=A0ABW3LNV3_9BACI